MLTNFKQTGFVLLSALLFFQGIAFAANDTDSSSTSITQQKGRVTGKVEDALGPVAGAAVQVKGTTNGTITDANGKFSIDINKGQTLVISFIGYVTKEIKYAGEQSLSVLLEENSQNLEEVVVTALGIKKEAKKLGYAVSTIAASDIVKTGTPNFATSLYGKASGVRIQAAPGGSTSAVSINIRGMSSITGTNQPLVIVDGVPVRNGDANKDGYWTDQRINSNGLVDINPEDIESLSILKGASASALYGSEAANGVVMITTKSGKGSQGIGVDFSANLNAEYIAYMPEIQTEYGPGYPVIYQNSGYEMESGGFYQRTNAAGQSVKSIRRTSYQWGPAYDGSDVYYWDGTTRKYNPITHNQWKDIFRTGINQTYNLAVTQGSEKGNMRFSYTYANDRPTQYNSSYNKHNFSLVGSYSLNDHLKLDYTVNYIRQNIKNRPYRISRLTNNYGGMFGSFEDVKLIRQKTITSMGYENTYGTNKTLTPDESFAWQPYGWALLDEYFWNIMGKEQLEDNNRLIASATPSWKIIDGLTLRGRVSTDMTSEKIENTSRSTRPLAFGSPTGSYGLTNKRYEIYYGEAMLMYDKSFGKFGINAYAGVQGREENVYNASVSTNGGLTVENWFHLNASKNTANSGMTKQEFLKTAVLGSLTLSYGDWIFVEATGRQEKTSTMHSGNNSFFYPSISASFIYTELFKDKLPSWYTYGKLRASYGIVGNAPSIYMANVAYTQSSISGYIYNQMTGTVGNESIKPEEKHEIELGLENKFFNNRLGFEISYYNNTIKDQILSTTMPMSSGASSILLNVGELKNHGMEFSMYGTPIENKDWRWDLRGNIAFNRNKVNKLQEGVNELVHDTYDAAVQLKSIVGQPMGDLYAYTPKTDSKGNKIVGNDGLYVIDYSERHKVGNAMPDAVGGISTSLSYKNIFLDATVDYRIGGDVLNQPYQYMMEIGNIKESLDHRNEKHGGLSYYFVGDPADAKCIATTASSGPNGEKIYHDGIILPGAKADGSVNQQMIPVSYYKTNEFGWGYSGAITYEKAVIDNSYVKLRELSLGYQFPKSITQKFNCRRLSLSVYGRNLFYFFRNMPMMDAEATDGTSWMSQAVIGGSTATTRTFGISLRASF